VLLSLCSISASVVRRAISPSSMLPNIGSTAVPWDWVPTVLPLPIVLPLPTVPPPPNLPTFIAIQRGLRSVEALETLETLESIKWVPYPYRLPIVCITCWYHRSILFTQGRPEKHPFFLYPHLGFSSHPLSSPFVSATGVHNMSFRFSFSCVSTCLWSCASPRGLGVGEEGALQIESRLPWLLLFSIAQHSPLIASVAALTTVNA
jgi:hypothetical protein